MAGFPSYSRKVINRQFQEYYVPPELYYLQKFFPMNTTDYSVDPSELRYVEEGAPFGMTMAHALNATVQLVDMPVGKVWKDKPLHFKEAIQLDEDDLLTVMRLDSKFAEREGTRLIARANRQLSYRLESRVEWTRAQALAEGQVAIAENGIKRTLNYGLDAIQPSTNAPWTNTEESDPIADIIDLVESYNDIGAENPEILMNRKQLGLMVKSDNVQDRIKRSSFLGKMGMKQIAALVLELAGVDATITAYNRGYRDASKNYQRFIPDGLLIAVAQDLDPMQGPIGEWASTPSLHKGTLEDPQAGKFAFPVDKTKDEENPYYKIVAGIYGGPVIFRPKFVKRLNVA